MRERGRGREEWERKRLERGREESGKREGGWGTADWGPLRHNVSHQFRLFNTRDKCITPMFPKSVPKF